MAFDLTTFYQENTTAIFIGILVLLIGGRWLYLWKKKKKVEPKEPVEEKEILRIGSKPKKPANIIQEINDLTKQRKNLIDRLKAKKAVLVKQDDSLHDEVEKIEKQLEYLEDGE